MSEIKTQWLSMATAFFVHEEYPPKEVVRPFLEWLDKEGYKEVKCEYSNMYASYYIDITTKTYMKAHSHALLATVVGYQGITFEDFKQIHYIFERTKEVERTWRYRPAYMTPLPLWLSFEGVLHEEHEKEKREYFEKDPSFEEWCEDVFVAIKEERWYKRYRPDYSREEFWDCFEDVLIRATMEGEYKNQKLPGEVAGIWDIISF